MEPFILKYEPKVISEVVGQDAAIRSIIQFLQTFKKGKYLVIQGPIGSGKSSSIYALGNELNYEILEINASDSRSKNSIEELLGSAVNQGSIFGNKKLVMVDEIDGMSGTKDRGGLQALIKIAQNSPTPIIMIAQDVTDRKYNTLRKHASLVTFLPLPNESILKVLHHIVRSEKLIAEEDALRAIASKAGGDLRIAINDLQVLSITGITKDAAMELSNRNKQIAITDALTRVLKTTKSEVSLGAYDDVAENIDKIFDWLEYNLPKEYKKLKDLAKAYDSLSVADVFFGRIRRWQYYRFYVYCYALLSVGISIAKEEKYSGMPLLKESSRPLMIWMTKNKITRKLSIADKLSTYTHCSTKAAFNMVNTLKPVLKKNPEILDLSKEEIEWLNK